MADWTFEGSQGPGVNSYVIHDGPHTIHLDQQTRQSVSALIKENKRLQNEPNHAVSQTGLRRMASLPVPLYWKWYKDWQTRFADDWDWGTFLQIRLQDPDYAMFRTTDETPATEKQLGAAFQIHRHAVQ